MIEHDDDALLKRMDELMHEIRTVQRQIEAFEAQLTRKVDELGQLIVDTPADLEDATR